MKSTAEGIARYVGKYVSKHIGERNEDKGARTVRFIGFKPGERTCSTRFAWHTIGSQIWRAKVALFARGAGARTMLDSKLLFGPNWAFVCFPAIQSMGGAIRRPSLTREGAKGVCRQYGDPTLKRD